MTDNERKLIELIRENDNQEVAITIAVNIITSFLEREQSSQGQAPVYPPGLA